MKRSAIPPMPTRSWTAFLYNAHRVELEGDSLRRTKASIND